MNPSRCWHWGWTVPVFSASSTVKPVPAYPTFRASICAVMRAAERSPPPLLLVLMISWKRTGTVTSKFGSGTVGTAAAAAASPAALAAAIFSGPA